MYSRSGQHAAVLPKAKMGWNFTLGWKENLLAAIMHKMWRESPKYEIKD